MTRRPFTGGSGGVREALAWIGARHGCGSPPRFPRSSPGAVVFSTGCRALDRALGTGGIPAGIVAEIHGEESTGKTTMALHVVAAVQAAGGDAAWIDAEYAFDPVLAARAGVRTEGLLLAQPSCGEEGLDVAEMLLRVGGVDVVVVDSVAALVPRGEFVAGERGGVGLQGRMMAAGLRRIAAAVRGRGGLALFLNQVRTRPDGRGGGIDTTPGGRALKCTAAVRIGLAGAGGRIRATVVKNRLAPPYGRATFELDAAGGGIRDVPVSPGRRDR